MDGRRIGPFRRRREAVAKLRAAPPALPPRPMPQFETAPLDGDPAFVRARSPEDAVAKAAGGGAVEVGEAAPGSGWREAAVDGEPWGRVRPRDRMRFRRD